MKTNELTIDCRTNQYFQSFLPCTVRAWNNLPPEAKQTDSLNSFKHFLNRDKSYVPKFYYSWKRLLQILHTRLRTNCSSLNNDLEGLGEDWFCQLCINLFKLLTYLCLKNITDSPLCRCGSIENTYHFFFFSAITTLLKELCFLMQFLDIVK